MLDRFDIIIEVLELSGQLLFSTKAAKASSSIAAGVVAAAKFAKNHVGLIAGVADNDPSAPSDTALDFGRYLWDEAAEVLRLALEKQQLSARGFYKVIRVARTIANLGQSQKVEREDVAQALP